MKNGTSRQQAKPARTPARKTTSTVSIPPVIAAFARMTDPDLDGLPPEFLEAWAQMPAVVQTYADGEDNGIDRVSRYSVQGDMTDREIAQSRAADPEDRSCKELAAAIDMLNAANPDWLAHVDSAYSRPAFYTGLALGLYLLSNPAPVALRTDGAR